MNKNIIGILGSTGKVGRYLTKILNSNYIIKCGYRSLDNYDFFKYTENIIPVKVNIDNESELMNFCLGCSIIVNCAGPSLKIGKKIAVYSTLAKAIYIDPYGSEVLKKQIIEENIEKENIYVLSAGSCPGFTEMLPIFISNSRLDRMDRVEVYSGNKENMGYAAGMDYVLSVKHGCGFSYAEILDGKINVDNSSKMKKIKIKGIDDNLYAQKYLYREFIDVAEKSNNFNNASFYNIFCNDELHRILLNACSIINISKDEKHIKNLIYEVSKLKIDLPWFIAKVKAEGIKDDDYVEIEYTVINSNSYEITAYIIYKVIQECFKKNISKGIYYASECLNAVETNKYILKCCKNIKVYEKKTFISQEEGII